MHKGFSEKVVDHFGLGRTNGTFGVEIEAEGFNLPAAVFGWDVHKEGSLRGEAKEYVTAGAVSSAELSKRLKLLTQVLGHMEARVDEASYRASTHIHVNVQDKTLTEVIGAIVCFMTVEPIFMRLCGKNRDGNLFCLPSYDCGDMPAYFSRLVKGMYRHGGVQGKIERGKYSALNTNNLCKLGTLEFRTFPCSVQHDQIMEWAKWCKTIVERGSSMVSLTDEIAKFYHEPMPFLWSVFGPDRLEQFTPVEIEQMVDLGCETAWEAARTFEWMIEEQEGKKAA